MGNWIMENDTLLLYQYFHGYSRVPINFGWKDRKFVLPENGLHDGVEIMRYSSSESAYARV